MQDWLEQRAKKEPSERLSGITKLWFSEVTDKLFTILNHLSLMSKEHAQNFPCAPANFGVFLVQVWSIFWRI
ncbi:MAG: hypothetical protein WC765_10150, partial [Phycisphaerae bacterium]